MIRRSESRWTDGGTEMMSGIDQAKLDAMMARVGKLLAVAEDSATTPEAAANYREKAESLMRDYRIAEEDVIAQDAGAILPTSKKVELLEDRGSDFTYQYQSMWYGIARHCGLRSVIRWEVSPESGAYAMVATAVGYASDIRYAELLWVSARMMFGSRLEPVMDRSIPEAEMVYRLRSSGIERNRIAKMMWGEATHSNNAKVTRLYVRACAERNEDPAVAGRSVSAKDYRTVYAREFVSRLARRLRAAQDAADSIGGGIQLHGREERVDEAFYERFPSYRPTPEPEVTEEAKPEEPCAKCAKAKTGKCRDHRTYSLTKADLRRVDRMYYSETARRAAGAGRDAADLVELSRTADRASRIEERREEGTAIEA